MTTELEFEMASPEAEDLIRWMLWKNPQARILFPDILNHPWLNEEGKLTEEVKDDEFLPNYLHETPSS